MYWRRRSGNNLFKAPLHQAHLIVLRTLGDHCNRRGFPNVQGNVTPLWFAAAAQNLLHLDLSKMRLSL